jgi:WD40 repeat protein
MNTSTGSLTPDFPLCINIYTIRVWRMAMPRVLVCVAVVWLAGCQAQVDVIPTASPTVEPTRIAPTVTTSPIPPTIEPTATLTPSPTPAGELSAGGPWLVFLASAEPDTAESLWAINADGTGLTRLSPAGVTAFDVRPGSEVGGSIEIAFILASLEQSTGRAIDYELRVLSLQDGTTEFITHLVSDDVKSMPDTSNYEEPGKYGIFGVLDHSSSLKWAPDGSKLAFLAALDNLSTDVYVFSPESGQIIRVSDGPESAYGIEWSPDSQYIVYSGFSTFWGAGAIPFDALWAARADRLATVRLLSSVPDPAEDLYYVTLHSWASSHIMMVEARHFYPYGSDLRSMDVETGRMQVIQECCVEGAAYDPETGVWLTTLERTSDMPQEFVLLDALGNRRSITLMSVDWIWWSPPLGKFIAQYRFGFVYLISPSGEVEQLSSEGPFADLFGNHPLISPDGIYWAWIAGHSQDPVEGLWIGSPNQGFPERQHQIVTDAIWSLESQTLFFMSDGLYMASAPEFEPETIAYIGPDNYQRDWQATWIP